MIQPASPRDCGRLPVDGQCPPKSACHPVVGQDDRGDSVVEHLELLDSWIVSVCEHWSTGSSTQCIFGRLTGVKRNRQLLVADIIDVGFP
jgi:hypothetical protein